MSLAFPLLHTTHLTISRAPVIKKKKKKDRINSTLHIFPMSHYLKFLVPFIPPMEGEKLRGLIKFHSEVFIHF